MNNPRYNRGYKTKTEVGALKGRYILDYITLLQSSHTFSCITPPVAPGVIHIRLFQSLLSKEGETPEYRPTPAALAPKNNYLRDHLHVNPCNLVLTFIQILTRFVYSSEKELTQRWQVFLIIMSP